MNNTIMLEAVYPNFSDRFAATDWENLTAKMDIVKTGLAYK